MEVKNKIKHKPTIKVDSKDKMYSDVSRLVKILERIAKRIEKEMNNNNYGR